ncbi:MAG: acetolactate synthase small subunit [Candidatus Omnitrophica bacterium CG1_02_46_14]|nr:MAG: acetolactate synthase small subunit [Candidatus Omnitrophica bacterium CG1_02_46_14]
MHDSTPIQGRTLSVLVENRSGVLSHVVGLFSARGFNIDSLAVGETEDPTASRITLVVRGDEKTLEQIKKQLNKLIDVIKIQDLTEQGCVDRELMLVKFKTSAKTKEALKPLLSQYHMAVIEENAELTIIECTETKDNTKKLFESLKNIGILEIAQTGAVALSKKN